LLREVLDHGFTNRRKFLCVRTEFTREQRDDDHVLIGEAKIDLRTFREQATGLDAKFLRIDHMQSNVGDPFLIGTNENGCGRLSLTIFRDRFLRYDEFGLTPRTDSRPTSMFLFHSKTATLRTENHERVFGSLTLANLLNVLFFFGGNLVKL